MKNLATCIYRLVHATNLETQNQLILDAGSNGTLTSADISILRQLLAGRESWTQATADDANRASKNDEFLGVWL